MALGDVMEQRVCNVLVSGKACTGKSELANRLAAMLREIGWSYTIRDARIDTINGVCGRPCSPTVAITIVEKE